MATLAAPAQIRRPSAMAGDERAQSPSKSAAKLAPTGQKQPAGAGYHSAASTMHGASYLAAISQYLNKGQPGAAEPPDSTSDAHETTEDGQLLSRFRIANLIGVGNYARVYRAFTLSGKELAVKAINLSRTSDTYKQKFLPRELTILRRIRHPNICKVHEIIQIADRVFIVMQFCPRGTIADLLHRLGALSEPVSRNLFSQTAEAVAYLHSLDLAHRDLKVENILLDGEFCPKLTDFSYSVQVRDAHRLQQATHKTTQTGHRDNHAGSQPPAGLPANCRQGPKSRSSSMRLNDTFCGTLPYLSPEIIRQCPYDSKKTDIWSLGICLYVMLNDRLPFPFHDIKLMVKRQMSHEFKFRASIEFSEQSKDLVRHMLEPEYQRRPSCADLLKHPWMFGPREKPAP